MHTPSNKSTLVTWTEDLFHSPSVTDAYKYSQWKHLIFESTFFFPSVMKRCEIQIFLSICQWILALVQTASWELVENCSTISQKWCQESVRFIHYIWEKKTTTKQRSSTPSILRRYSSSLLECLELSCCPEEVVTQFMKGKQYVRCRKVISRWLDSDGILSFERIIFA